MNPPPQSAPKASQNKQLSIRQIKEQEQSKANVEKNKRHQEWVQKKQQKEIQEEREFQELLVKSVLEDSPEVIRKMDADSIGLESLIDQNMKLKETLKMLIEEAEVVQKQEFERKLKRVSKIREPQTEKDLLGLKKVELKVILQEVSKYEKHINGLQRELENNYDINRIMAKEDELALLTAEYQALTEVKENQLLNSSSNVKQNELLKNQEMHNTKIKLLEQKLQDGQKVLDEYTIQLQQLEMELKKLHKNVTFKEERIKQMQIQLKEKQRFPDKQFYVSEEEILVLGQRLNDLEKEEKDEEKQYQNQMIKLDNERKEKTKDAESRLTMIKELEKELNMNQFKYKQLSKLVRHNVLLPIDKK